VLPKSVAIFEADSFPGESLGLVEDKLVFMKIAFGLLFILFLQSCAEVTAQTISRKVNADRKRGEILIKAYQCNSCHIINGTGAKDGLSLDNLKRSKKFIADHIMDPEEHVTKNGAPFNFDPSLMPSHQLTRAECEAIAEYLLHKADMPKTNKITKQSKRSLKHK
jgi:mono/diheme cytochrome c family protein